MTKTKEGLVFNIQRYSIHDGTGIRTIIFFKGCPLACPWCSNPESRKAVAPIKWLKNGQEEVIGEWYTSEALVKEVLKDEIFYRTSGGGVTLSGGEVLMQSEFAEELLSDLKELGIHTSIETTGCFEVSRLQSILPYVDQILFDLKIMNNEQSKRMIGADVETVKANFELALSFKEDIEVIPRILLIPDYTINLDNLSAIIEYLKELAISEVHLLPFHQCGSSKYEYLGWNYQLKEVQPLTKKEIEGIKTLFEDNKIQINVEGLE